MIPTQEMTAVELDQAGLLKVEGDVHISRCALFVPVDKLGVSRVITIEAGARIGPFAIIHGGAQVGSQAQIEEHAVVGKPELGYAVGETHTGAGATTKVGAGATIRSGAVVYADVRIGMNTLVGHHTLLRTGVRLGDETLLGHHLVVERKTRIGQHVRCSPGSHLTSSIRIADRVFLGAGVRTVNDQRLTWRDPRREPSLVPPVFCIGAKVGSGTTVLSGVTVGEHALVGAGSVVTRDVPPGMLAYGNPARVQGRAAS
jgi:acetyltransferase-like isoleucine patch superfamily enzyme